MALNPCPECGNMVSDTATSCPKCGYTLETIKVVPSNSQKQFYPPQKPPQKPMGCMKIGLIVGGAVFGLLTIFGIIAECSGESTKTLTETNNLIDNNSIEKDTTELTKEELALKNLNSIEKEIVSIKEGVDFSTFRGSVQQLQLEIILFATMKFDIMLKS